MAKRPRGDSLPAPYPASDDVHTPKFLELEAEADQGDSEMRIECNLPPHKPIAFSSYPVYETHYIQSHTNRCSECDENFPSAHFLDLHLAENHDPIVAARRDKGQRTFACFVAGCDKVCLNWKKRRSHLVDKHGFPKNYDFFIVNTGTDGRGSMLRLGIDVQGHRKSSRERQGSSASEPIYMNDATSANQSRDAEDDDDTKDIKSTQATVASMEDVTKSLHSLQFVPRSVTFGKRKGKSGFAKR